MRNFTRPRNPFGATKAADLNDAQIQNLWVDVLSMEDQLDNFGHPNSSVMPSFVLGAKGSGKTHLMRYHSFELQVLRYKSDPTVKDVQDGIARDGYIGIYALCGSINSGRFSGKGQSDEVWREIFAYYLELWLAHHILEVVKRLGLELNIQSKICKDIAALFDRPFSEPPDNISDLACAIADLQRKLDFAVNNAVITRELQVEILTTRGRLIFGVPKILAVHCQFLNNVIFVYSIDEFENLTEDQQRVVNSLIRDKQIPATLRIGARLYGIKTYQTDGAEEENLRESEYENLYLDRIFRDHKDKYARFARELVSKRLSAACDISNLSYEIIDDAWNGSYFVDLVRDSSSSEAVYFKSFRSKLKGVRKKEVDQLVKMLSVEDYPLLEKLNLLLFYKLANGKDERLEFAKQVRDECQEFIANPKQRSPYSTALDHYKSDLSAQMQRESGGKQYYLGLDTFIMMSAGLPRALLTILRSVVDWSMFRGEDPLGGGKISKDAQYGGVRDATDWFYENMRKAGEEGRVIQAATDRLAQLFRVNRFSDRPAEISLCAFGIFEGQGSEQATRVLRLAEERSFLNRVNVRKGKNAGTPLRQFQINPMLAPRWDLPLARRGVTELTDDEFNAIFAPKGEEEFQRVLENWKKQTGFSTKYTDDYQRKLL